MKKPKTFTGEDIVEISAHGGPVILKKILNLCLQNGSRLAERGEFSFRAFSNGKMDLAKAESVADLIASKTELAAKAASNQLHGALSEKIEAWRKKLTLLLSSLEAALDHAEEDIKFTSNKEIKKQLNSLLSEIIKLQSTAEKGKLLRNGLKIAIIGKPNTGKSSLLNALLERERAIVTDIPGTTRDVLEEALEINGIPVVIVDTAGIRSHSQDSVEKKGQELTKKASFEADLIFWLFDASQNISHEDQILVDLISANRLENKVLVVLNKTDLPTNLSEPDIKKIYPGKFSSVKISAIKGTGIKNLENSITSFVHTSNVSLNEPLIITIRHNEVLVKVVSALNEALNSVNKKESEEFSAFHIKTALNILGEITGETATEEILSNIFSKFCVGK